MKSLRVWDLPTRLFHWLLVLLVIGLVVTSQVGGNWMVWHMRMGYAVLALVLFRIVWGVVGGHWSRFVNFLYGPSQVLAYLRDRAPLAHRIGHNPLGALSVFALLGLLLLQASTGLFADDEIAFAGPLTKFVSGAWVSNFTWWHKVVGKWGLLALVSLHVLAVLFYLLVKKENLVRPMVSGDKTLAASTTEADLLPPSADATAQRVTAALILAACAGLVYWIVALGG
jgi:cytochrome b